MRRTTGDDLGLVLFECGTLRLPRHTIYLNQGLGEPYEIPISWFVVTHPRGNVLIDGGNPLAVARDPAGHWGEDMVAEQVPTMREEDFCVEALRAAGIDPESIAYVVQTHLHLDHTGAIGSFPHARFLVQRAELEYAWRPDWFQARAYVRADFDRDDVAWTPIDGVHEDGYDVHGDGAIRLLFTPGHSPGHQSVVVDLPESGPMVLAADAAYTLDHYEHRALPGQVHCSAEAVRSVDKLRREVDRLGATLVPGHDPEAWRRFELAPFRYR